MQKTKHTLILVCFALLLCGGMVLHLLLPDKDLSKSERRKLEQLPKLSWSAVESGQYMQDLESYLLDQFPGRDSMRTVKSLWTYYVMGQKDNNGIYISKDPYSEHNTVSKLDTVLDEKQVALFTQKMTALHEQYFPDSPVWCVPVPDKNYFLAQTGEYPALDYERLLTMVEDGMPWADVRRNLFNDLISDSYYITDSHWRQEKLQWAVEDLAAIMGLELPAYDTYTQTTLPGFRGVYYGQSALPLPAEDLIYLENEVTKNAVVTGPELKGPQPVYAPEKFSGNDGYDVFLHGAQAIQTIENPLAETDRELIIFRDSFGSSLAPLLLPTYKTVTLVDIRYVDSMFLSQFVDFHGQDVLILYSTTVINSAGILR